MLQHVLFKPGPGALGFGFCNLCGQFGPLDHQACKVYGPNFTDQDQLKRPDAESMCDPCVRTLAGTPPNTLRMWSVVYRQDRSPGQSNPKARFDFGQNVQLTTKGDTLGIVDLLVDPPHCDWCVSITTSGQIHHVPFATMRHVRFERTTLTIQPLWFAETLLFAAELYRLGHSVTAITSGQYRHATVAQAPLQWMFYHDARTSVRGSLRLELAC